MALAMALAMEPARARARLIRMTRSLHNGMRVAADMLVTIPATGLPPGFHQVNSRFGVHNNGLLDAGLATYHQRAHPCGIAYPVPAALRAAAHALTNPNFTVGGFGALALYGLEFLVEGTDTVLMTDLVTANRPASACAPAVLRWQPPRKHLWQVEVCGRSISIASPGLAVVQALAALRKEDVQWKVVDTPEHSATFIRAVQLVDAARNQLGVDSADILRAGPGRVDMRWLTQVIITSSALADSPKETEMRLLAEPVVDGFGLVLSEQVPVLINDKHITRFDLAIIELKIGIMFDGAHHWTKDRRDKDSEIDLSVIGEDWLSLRFSEGTLPGLPKRLPGVIEKRLASRRKEATP